MSQFYYQQYAKAAGGSRANTAAGFVGPLRALAVEPQVAHAYSALWLRPGAPLPVVKAAYRALASHHHPDAGGDAVAMRQLNVAFETLERYLGAREG